MFKAKTILGVCALIGGMSIFIGAILYNQSPPTHVPYNDFKAKVEAGEVEKVELSNEAHMKFYLDGSEDPYVTDNPRNPEIKEYLLLEGVKVTETANNYSGSILQSILGFAFFGGAIFCVYKISGKNNVKSAMSLNFTDATFEVTKQLAFSDIAGNEEAKDSVLDIVDFIKNPGKFEFYGARVPRGVIFYGPPGTGKTLMAKAVAGEAGVPFYAVSGSDFVQMYVGVGANRVRELFKKARESGKAVIFIDEIDAIGKKRSGNTHGASDERDQTLNALLTEMSGFSSKDGIIIIAATNRIDILDEALLRPGRFDRQVEIGLPDINARERILKYHSKNKPISKDVNYGKLAKETIYFSGAMLENLLNEGAIFSAKRSAPTIERQDLEKAYYTILAGSEKKERNHISEKEKTITAYHEAGHAIVGKLALPENTISKITIIPGTKGTGGFCVNIPTEKNYYSKKDLEANIMVSLGGRASEELIFGADNITTGAVNDIEKATNLVKDYISIYGMGEHTGLLNMSLFADNGEIIKECSKLMERLYLDTKKLIENNMGALEALSKELIIKESLCEEDINRLVG